MERRDNSPELFADTGPSAVPDSPILAGASHSNPCIEDYLDHLCVPLVGRVPYDARATLRSELRAHLEALIDASEELGQERGEAVRHALAQFGDPQALGREWLRGWQRSGQKASVQSARPAAFVAFGCFGLATSLAVALVLASAAATSHMSFLNPLWPLLYVAVMPLLAGLATGLLSPGRQALGTFYALALLVLLTAGGGSVLVDGWGLNDLPAIGIVQGVCWIPIGCASAALGGWLRALRERTPRWVLPA
jgi:hypothetical protein